MKLKSMRLSLVMFAFCEGCSSMSVQRTPKFDPSRYHRIFVEQPLNENHHVDEILADELNQIGRGIGHGPLTMLPDQADAVLKYESTWTWDFKTYMIELDLQLYTAHTDRMLAQARYFQPTVLPKSPDEIAKILIGRLFAEQAKSKSPSEPEKPKPTGPQQKGKVEG